MFKLQQYFVHDNLVVENRLPFGNKKVSQWTKILFRFFLPNLEDAQDILTTILDDAASFSTKTEIGLFSYLI